MRDAVMTRFPDATVVIKCAAVADYRVKEAATQKIKRAGAITLELEPNPDILAELGETRFDKHILVGFAAETENIIENARKKLEKKRVDMIVANDVSKSGIGFNSERNSVVMVTADEFANVSEAPKFEVAQRVLDTVVRLRKSKSAAGKSEGVRA
jgi:phosphopantothenoylcysteine decarboxylase/phosphopantothenate--cysteine ligase